jgi:hypothetical protein
MAPGALNVGSSAHSDELHRLLAGRKTAWYKGRLLKLNLVLLLLLITSSTNGYDGSMMNGLQALDTWIASFGNPQGGLLGLFNAIQVSIGMPVLLSLADSPEHWRYRWSPLWSLPL